MTIRYCIGGVLWACLATTLPGCSTPNPTPQKRPAPHVVKESTQPEWFGPEVWAYKWFETTVEDLENEHFGRLLFLRRGDRVYSLAWPSKSPNNWPIVKGVGTFDHKDRTLKMVYRTASGLLEHEFYHAICEFKFGEKKQSFEVTYEQQASEDEGQALEPGMSRGVRWTEGFGQMEDYVSRLKRWSNEELAGAHFKDRQRCSVLPHITAKPEIITKHQGKIYRFCCTSCREVFLKKPDAFIHTSPSTAP